MITLLQRLILNMEAVGFIQTSVILYPSTRRNILEY